MPYKSPNWLYKKEINKETSSSLYIFTFLGINHNTVKNRVASPEPRVPKLPDETENKGTWGKKCRQP